MLKFCNSCGRLYEDKCVCKKDRKNEYRHVGFYDTKAWQACSRFVRTRDYNIDRLQLYFQKYEPENETERNLYDYITTARNYNGRLLVHHVKPINESWDDRYKTENMITIEFHVHEYIHQLYNTKQKEDVQNLLFKAINAELP